MYFVSQPTRYVSLLRVENRRRCMGPGRSFYTSRNLGRVRQKDDNVWSISSVLSFWYNCVRGSILSLAKTTPLLVLRLWGITTPKYSWVSWNLRKRDLLWSIFPPGSRDETSPWPPNRVRFNSRERRLSGCVLRGTVHDDTRTDSIIAYLSLQSLHNL